MENERQSWSARVSARAGATSVALLAVVGLMACGGSDGDAGTASTSAAAARGDFAAQTDRALAASYEGTDRRLPDDGPKGRRGRTVWSMACTLAAAGCADAANAAAEAARSLGWQTRVVDGKVDPTAEGAALRSAVAAKADAMILVGIDCSTISSALEQAKADGLRIFGIAALDCDADGGRRLFDGTVQLGRFAHYETAIREDQAVQVADYVIARTDGKAKVVQLDAKDIAANRFFGEGFAAQMATCADCEVFEVPITAQDFVQNRLGAIATAALTQHPDANALVVPSDPAITLGVGAAVAQAEAGGREILLGSVGGYAPNLEMIAGEGPQDFTIGGPTAWMGWAAVDGVNRLLAGAPQADAGIGYQAIDRDHPSPSGLENYDGNARSARYADNYRRIWGVGG